MAHRKRGCDDGRRIEVARPAFCVSGSSTFSVDQYPASVTPWSSQFVTGARAMSLQLAAASYIDIHYA
jgi:hypothetical protein